MNTSEKFMALMYKSVYQKDFRQLYPVVFEVFKDSYTKRKFKSPQIQRMWDAYVKARTS